MLKLLVDEHVPRSIVLGLRSREPALDILEVKAVGLRRAADDALLEWAAQEGRVFVTYDVNTAIDAAYDRVRAGKPMPGVFAVTKFTPVGVAIEHLLILAVASNPGEWENQVAYVPL